MTKEDYRAKRSNWRLKMRLLARHAVKRGLALPIDWQVKQAWANGMGLLKRILAEEKERLNAMREATDMLDGCASTVSRVKESNADTYGTDKTKYGYKYHLGTLNSIDEDLAAHNSPDYALVRHAATKLGNELAPDSPGYENTPESKLATVSVRELMPAL